MQMGMAPGNQPVMILDKNMKKDEGAKAQLSAIMAGKAVASIVRSTLGPNAMLKLLLDPMGGIVLTNDGQSILREIDVGHPAAKSMLEMARAQDEEVGDGTTSVVVLAGELMGVAEPLLELKLHPTVITSSYTMALNRVLATLKKISTTVAIDDAAEMEKIVAAAVDTKGNGPFGKVITEMAVRAVRTVAETEKDGSTSIDVKRYVKVEKLAGGEVSECRVLDGVMFNKDVTHGRMRRLIKKPRVVILDCPLEYKKSESATNMEITKEEDWEALLLQEEKEVEKLCDAIRAVKPDVVITEKGVSDLAQHFLMKSGISVIRRIRKTDNNRVARVTGANIVSRCEELEESDVGKDAARFEVSKVGDEYYAFLTESKNARACSVILRGASRDVLNEVERNLHDGLQVARNVMLQPMLLPGGGATEMALAHDLRAYAKTIAGREQYGVNAVADALEIIPRVLTQNSGMNVIKTMAELRAAAADGKGVPMGVEGKSGRVMDTMKEGIFDTYSVKKQAIQAAVESACLLLRIDGIYSGATRGGGRVAGATGQAQQDANDVIEG